MFIRRSGEAARLFHSVEAAIWWGCLFQFTMALAVQVPVWRTSTGFPGSRGSSPGAMVKLHAAPLDEDDA